MASQKSLKLLIDIERQNTVTLPEPWVMLSLPRKIWQVKREIRSFCPQVRLVSTHHCNS